MTQTLEKFYILNQVDREVLWDAKQPVVAIKNSYRPYKRVKID